MLVALAVPLSQNLVFRDWTGLIRISLERFASNAEGLLDLTALKQRPSDALVQNFRSDALVKAGKPDAAGR